MIPRRDYRARRGRWAEEVVCKHLRRQGLRLVARNYRCPHGEIDLVMRDRADLVFVEVRFRRTSQFGAAAESVDGRKQAKLRATAEYYLQRHRDVRGLPCRFDVAGVTDEQGQTKIEWIRNAF